MEEKKFDEAQKYMEEALSVAQELNIKYAIANDLTWLGILFSFQGNLLKSKQSLLESMSLVRELNIFFTQHLLKSLMVSPYFQTAPDSVKLLGALRSFQVKTYTLKNPWLQRYADYAETQLRTSLGESAFESAFAEGQKLSLEEALNLAQDMIEAM